MRTIERRGPVWAAVLTVTGAAVQAAERVPVIVNGKKLSTAARLVPGADRTLLPMRALFAAMGAQVTWDPSEKAAYAWNDGGSGVRIVIGERWAQRLQRRSASEPGGREQVTGTTPLDVPARIIGGRVYLPLRFAAEALQADVHYSAADPSIRIRTDAAGPGEQQGIRSCVNRQAGFRVSYPRGWHTNPGDVMPECSVFHPGPIRLEPATEIPFGLAIVFRVEAVPFERAARPGESEQFVSYRETTIDGRRAVRVEARNTRDLLRPAGTRSTSYRVKLDGKTLFAVTYDAGPLSYERKKQILDRMVRTLQFTGRQ